MESGVFSELQYSESPQSHSARIDVMWFRSHRRDVLRSRNGMLQSLRNEEKSLDKAGEQRFRYDITDANAIVEVSELCAIPILPSSTASKAEVGGAVRDLFEYKLRSQIGQFRQTGFQSLKQYHVEVAYPNYKVLWC